MTLITVDVTLPLGTFVLDVQFSSDCRSIALFGPSGSGKTSLANVMAGLLTPQTGHIGINGTTLFDSAAGINLTPQQRGIGYVFQDNRLFPHMTIKDNLVYGQKWAPPNQNGPTFDDIVGLLDIGHLLNRTPAKLSGGESQRVAIGRALLMRPRIVLLDEPLASLDQERKAEIIHYLLKIRQASLAASLAPMITISHAPEEVNRLDAAFFAVRLPCDLSQQRRLARAVVAQKNNECALPQMQRLQFGKNFPHQLVHVSNVVRQQILRIRRAVRGGQQLAVHTGEGVISEKRLFLVSGDEISEEIMHQIGHVVAIEHHSFLAVDHIRLGLSQFSVPVHTACFKLQKFIEPKISRGQRKLPPFAHASAHITG
jgi:molybdate transport system ATP-binding protein